MPIWTFEEMVEKQDQGELFVLAQRVTADGSLADYTVESYSRIDDGFVAVSDPMMLADALLLFGQMKEVINGAA